jgi:putative SOS response-associated peptidase YedK
MEVFGWMCLVPPFPWHYFILKDQKIFGFAGLYDVWKDKETGKEIKSYTIITTMPNSLVAKIHDWMPVILNPEDEAVWLDPDITEPERLLPLLKQYPAVKMEEWQVGDAARNPKNDYPEIIKKPKVESSKGNLTE